MPFSLKSPYLFPFSLMTKILVADPISPVGVERLKACEGFEVVEAHGSSHEQIHELAAAAVAPAMINVRIRIIVSLLYPIVLSHRRSVTAVAMHRTKF